MKNYVKKGTSERGHIYYFNKKGQFHRLDGPAIEYKDGDKSWYLNGKRHREDGPSLEYKSMHSWYIHGICYSEENFKYILYHKESYKFSI